MKTYYLTLSRNFPNTHDKAGMPTFFFRRIKDGSKIHTIRANYEFWKKRFEKITKGEAILSIREWVGKPYGKGSTQHELIRLTHKDGIGIQKLQFVENNCCLIDDVSLPSIRILANNDGLSLEDWEDWFSTYDLSKPMAIIHFSSFRY